MFENRINGFGPNLNAHSFTPGVLPAGRATQAASNIPVAVQIADIYQAAVKRAIEEHELDKLFNPDFYDYQI
jgi:hypothetical protein